MIVSFRLEKTLWNIEQDKARLFAVQDVIVQFSDALEEQSRIITNSGPGEAHGLSGDQWESIGYWDNLTAALCALNDAVAELIGDIDQGLDLNAHRIPIQNLPEFLASTELALNALLDDVKLNYLGFQVLVLRLHAALMAINTGGAKISGGSIIINSDFDAA